MEIPEPPVGTHTRQPRTGPDVDDPPKSGYPVDGDGDPPVAGEEVIGFSPDGAGN